MLSKIKLLPKLLLIVLIVLGIFWLRTEFNNPLFFPINQVQIKATYQHLDPENIQKTIAPFVNANFFSIKVNQIKQSILQLPWVYAVSINRVWPNKLVIKITEQQAAARWNNNALLNSNADIFIPNAADLPDDLPNLFGPDDQAEEVWHSYQQMNQAIKNLDLGITGLGLNSQGCWRLVLNNGINVILGNEAIMKRFYKFIKVYPKIIGANGENVANVDLRYSNGLAIKWKHIKK